MGKLILYHLSASPPARGVQLTAKAIGIELELRSLNFFEGEHLSEDFKKKNPQHTIPTLEDEENGEIIWDSHAIATYLIGKCAKDESLYPRDLSTRAKIDQRLHFDSGILFPRLRGALEPILLQGERELPQEKRDAILQAFDFLEAFLKTDKYLVGNTMTVADLCSIPTVTSLGSLEEIDAAKYPRLTEWIKRMEKLPYYYINQEGNDQLKGLYLAKIAETA